MVQLPVAVVAVMLVRRPSGASIRRKHGLYRTLALPHQEGDHARAGRGRRGGWRAAEERRHLVPWAQEAERIGVPAPHHGRGPGRGEARDERDVAVEVLRGREAPAPAVDAEGGAGAGRRRRARGAREAVHWWPPRGGVGAQAALAPQLLPPYTVAL